MSKKLTLDLDSLWEEPYIYTEFDIGGSCHSVTINAEDREAFLNAFAQAWRDRAEIGLDEIISEEEQKLFNALEERTLFAFCKNTVEDGLGNVACIVGKQYLVLDIQESVYTIETEESGCTMSIPKDDCDFMIVIQEWE